MKEVKMTVSVSDTLKEYNVPTSYAPMNVYSEPYQKFKEKCEKDNISYAKAIAVLMDLYVRGDIVIIN